MEVFVGICFDGTPSTVGCMVRMNENVDIHILLKVIVKLSEESKNYCTMTFLVISELIYFD